MTNLPNWASRAQETADKQLAELYPDLSTDQRVGFLRALMGTLNCGPQAAIMFLAANPDALKRILLNFDVTERCAGLLIMGGAPDPVYCVINDAQIGLALVGPQDRWISFSDFRDMFMFEEVDF